MQPVTGGFVGLVSSALQFSLCSWKWACLGAFCEPAGMCCAYAQIWSESMSDPVQDQSSHHSHSVRDDKMQAVTSSSPAAACCFCCFCKASTSSDIYVISLITLFSLCPKMLPISSFSVSSFYEALQVEPWISWRTFLLVSRKQRETVRWKMSELRGCECLHIQWCEYMLKSSLLCQTKKGQRLPATENNCCGRAESFSV